MKDKALGAVAVLVLVGVLAGGVAVKLLAVAALLLVALAIAGCWVVREIKRGEDHGA